MSGDPSDKNFHRTVPDGDERERLVCKDCGFIHYENPRVIVGSVVVHDGKFLLCKRAIEPRKGFWTLPAGFLELGETTAAGAKREAWEEARAEIEIDALLAVYDVLQVHQVQIFYRAKLVSPRFEPGPESEEVELFAWDDIPWEQIAFPTVRWVLDAWREVADRKVFAPFTGNRPRRA